MQINNELIKDLDFMNQEMVLPYLIFAGKAGASQSGAH
jgi:hypothetical protein